MGRLAGKIYCVTNTANGKQYVGQTRFTLATRWRHHLRAARDGSTFAIHCAIRKYGPELFKIEQIDIADSLEELNRKEEQYIAKLRTIVPSGYNLTGGGEGREVSEETRKKLSEAAAGVLPSEDTRSKLSRIAATKSHEVSEDVRRGISDKLLGHEVSEETRRKISQTKWEKTYGKYRRS